MNPRKRLVSLATAISLGLSLAGANASPASSGAVQDVVIFATNSVRLSSDVQVTSGNIVVNQASPGPTLGNGFELYIDKKTTVAGNASADSIQIFQQASVAGTVFFNDLTNSGSVGGTSSPLIFPVLSNVPPFVTGQPRGSDVFVPPGGSAQLAAGGFRNITAGDLATIVFTGGVYDIQSIDVQGDVTLVFNAPSEVRISGKFRTRRRAVIGPGPGCQTPAGGACTGANVVFYVAGVNGSNGGLNSTPEAARIGSDSAVSANFYAPNGTLRLEVNTVAAGAFLGRDVMLDRGSRVTLESAFANKAPTAFPQEVQTNGSNPLVITLEGSDPEGKDLSFTDPVPVPPTQGTLGPITPITPPTVQRCSLAGSSCTVAGDCPGFGQGETCDTVQPPITQATVTYTPTAANCVTEPSGAVACPGDFFTFAVQDDCGAQATAVVRINGGTNEAPGDPGAGVVEAKDLEVSVTANEVRTITLTAAAPNPPVSSITFRVETLPSSGTLKSGGNPVVPLVDLTSPVLTYEAPNANGNFPFTFSARDSSTPASPCGPPSCDTATVNILVADLRELAPDQSVSTDLNTPVEITLFANPGGSGSGGQGPQAAGAQAVEVTYGDNGPPMTRSQLDRLAARNRGRGRGRTDRAAAAAPQSLSPTPLTVGQGWFQFGWCDEASLQPPETCANRTTLTNLLNPTEVIESPFTFSVGQASCLRVTDALSKGDHWRVEAQVEGGSAWTEFTSLVPQSTVGTTSDPNAAFQDDSYSHGAFDLIAGTYSVRLITIPPNSFSWGTTAFIRVDTGSCQDIVWEITSLPDGGTAPGTLTNLNGTSVNVGTKYFSLPTLVFTPNLNLSGSTSFTYKVTQGGIFGGGVVDTAQVAIDVFFDQCPINGRPIGCAPPGGGGSGPQSQGPSQQALEREVARGPSKGLTVTIEGAGGSVATSPVPLSRGRLLAGLLCHGGSCNKLLPEGAEITLYARPDGEHFEFLGWSGDCRGDEPILTMRLSEHTRCVAYFGETDPRGRRR